MEGRFDYHSLHALVIAPLRAGQPVSDSRIGSTIAHYHLTAKLGEGGMGEVYRATDTRLEREVAIKVLPEAFVEDEERLARLEREARLLAQLSHPNVAAIHGLEEGDGVRALVLELVEGPTLAERLSAGTLSLEESLDIARQVAAALEEAHERGIVHRDLKPQNVKAPIDGPVKVLDFGLAKALDPVAESSGDAPHLSASPTMTLGATVQGVILGTAGYMAPEQAKGMAVDKRADIWAFGVVLWEMLVGTRLFVADTVPDTLARVLLAEVDLDALPPSTPSPIRRLLRRCLERQPKKRLRDIGDARLVIEEVQRGDLEEVAPVPEPESARRTGPWIAVLLAVGLAAAGLGWLLRGGPESPPPLALPLALPTGTIDQSDQISLALSPDGRRHVLTVIDPDGETRLMLRDLEVPGERPLPGTEGGFAPFFSPDGRSIGFFTRSGLFVLSIEDPVPRRVASSDAASRGATWSRDGYIYFSPTGIQPLMRVPVGGGEVETVLELDHTRRERTQRWPAALPDGSAVIFTSDDITSTEYYDDARIEAVRPETGERTLLVEEASMARFLPPDRLLFARGGAVYAVAFDPRSLEVTGNPVPLLPGVHTRVTSGAAQFAVSDSGAALWLTGAETANERGIEHLDPEGRSQETFLPPDHYEALAVSPDGSQLALTITGDRTVDLWVADLERETLSRRTFEMSIADVVWSPDGNRIAYGVESGASLGPRLEAVSVGMHWKPADGSGVEEPLGGGGAPQWPISFTPDGRGLIFEQREDDSDVWILELGSGEPPRPLLDSALDEYLADLSPDGRLLAYTLGRGDESRIMVRSFPDAEGLWQVAESAVEPHWSADGKTLFYRTLGGEIRRVSVDASEGMVTGSPETVTTRAIGGPSVFSAMTFDVGPDGALWVLKDATANADLALMQWTDLRRELERRESTR